VIMKHPLDPQDTITMAKLHSVVASTTASVPGGTAATHRVAADSKLALSLVIASV
jgi:hypothetical protein